MSWRRRPTRLGRRMSILRGRLNDNVVGVDDDSRPVDGQRRLVRGHVPVAVGVRTDLDRCAVGTQHERRRVAAAVPGPTVVATAGRRHSCDGRERDAAALPHQMIMR